MTDIVTPLCPVCQRRCRARWRFRPNHDVVTTIACSGMVATSVTSARQRARVARLQIASRPLRLRHGAVIDATVIDD